MNKNIDYNEKFISKGIRYDPGLERVEKKLAEKISEINLQFEDEPKTIDDDNDSIQSRGSYFDVFPR
jgi:hypothetical protein